MYIFWFDFILLICEFGDVIDGNEDVNVVIIWFDIMIIYLSFGLDGIMMLDEYEYDVKVVEILVVDFFFVVCFMCF